jgi:hypothetical protein
MTQAAVLVAFDSSGALDVGVRRLNGGDPPSPLSIQADCSPLESARMHESPK